MENAENTGIGKRSKSVQSGKKAGNSGCGVIRLTDDMYPRMEHFRHFSENRCAITMTDDIDVTALRGACHECRRSFYVTFLYIVSYIVNSRDEFRMTTVDGKPAVYEHVNPVHNVFHEDTETYTSIFTLWNRNYHEFCQNCEEDIMRGHSLICAAVPSPANSFEASCVPWRHFTHAGVNTGSLLPIIVWGGFTEQNGKTVMPLSITIDHAAADGFHAARFLNEAERLSAAAAANLKSRGCAF